MEFESPLSPEELQKKRSLNDAELLKNGANFIMTEKGELLLEPTESQEEDMRNEMEQDFSSQYSEFIAAHKEKIGTGVVVVLTVDARQLETSLGATAVGEVHKKMLRTFAGAMKGYEINGVLKEIKSNGDVVLSIQDFGERTFTFKKDVVSEIR